MIKKIQMDRDKPVINLIPKIVYGHRMEGSNAVYRPVNLSLMRPRMSFPYDEKHSNLFLKGQNMRMFRLPKRKPNNLFLNFYSGW